MIIYNNGTPVLNIEVDDNSYCYKSIMGENALTLYFSLAEHVEIPVGSYCTFENETYTLLRPEALKMQHTRCFEYTVTMESVQSKAKIWKFRNPVDGRLKFPLTAKPHEHLQMFVDNMNRKDSGWTVGECIDGVETLVSYDHAFCWDALSQMAETFSTEFEIVGKEVSLHKVEYNKDSPLPLSYGRGNGFKPGIGRTNYNEQPPIKTVYVEGGDRNIDYSTYGNSTLLLPKSQTIRYDGEHFEDEEGYDASSSRLYGSDEQGYCVQRLDPATSNIAEESIDCTSIYPKYEGRITSVITVDADKHFYDFRDTNIPLSLDFSAYQIEGEKMTVVFQDGMLAGREFEVNYYHTASGGKQSRRFEIIPQDIDGMTMPGGDFIPRAGNTYAIFNCRLPQAYINTYDEEGDPKQGAEWELMRYAVRYLYDHEEQTFTFNGTLDGIWAKKDWANIGGKILLGGYVLFTDARFQQEGVKIRIIGVKKYINNPYSPEIELSNNTVSGGFSTSLKKIESQEVVMEENHKESIQFTKRRFRDAQETISMIESALLENFSASVNPITVQTMAMLVGDESLQYQFIDSIQTLNVVAHNVTYDSSTQQLTAPSGLFQHMTLGINTLSNQHSSADYQFWEVGAFTSAQLSADKKYYLYIKADKSSTKGVANYSQFYLSETAKPMEGTGADTGYYFFLYGILNSEYEGERSFVPLYGYTEVLPGRITTERIVSGNGESYFDMVNNALKLGELLKFNVNGDGKLTLKGTFVQSTGSNISSPIGCWRGAYDPSLTYYKGDEVTYEFGGVTSTYRYIYDTGSSTVPTNTTYWQVIAQGSQGNSVSIKGRFSKHYADMSAWYADTHGDWEVSLVDAYDAQASMYTYAIAYIPVGSQYQITDIPCSPGDSFVRDSDGHLWTAGEQSWMDIGQFRGQDGQKGNYTEYRYQVNGSTVRPTTQPTTELNPSGWSTQMPTVTASLKYVWVISAQKSGDGQTLLSNWSTAVRMSGADGVNGTNGTDGADGTDGRSITGVLEQYAVSSDNTTAPESGWQTTMPAMTAELKYLWNRTITIYSSAPTEEVSNAVVIGMYSEDGVGIASITEYYLASSQPQVTKSTSGWSTAIQYPTEQAPYLYNYERITYTDGRTQETDIALLGHYGKDGAKGADALPVAVCYRGTYGANKAYYGNSSRVDVVKYNNAYYVARTDAPGGAGGFTNITPTNDNYWNPFGGSFESVATDLLLAELANIGGFIFRRSRIESQMLSDGTTTDGTTTKSPMIYLNGQNGEASFAGGKVLFNSDGTVNIAGGKFTVDSGGNVALNDITANNGLFNGRINVSGGLRQTVKRITNIQAEKQDDDIGNMTMQDSIIYVRYNYGSELNNQYRLRLTFRGWGEGGQSQYDGQRFTIINASQRDEKTQTFDGRTWTLIYGYYIDFYDQYGNLQGSIPPGETRDLLYISDGHSIGNSDWILF